MRERNLVDEYVDRMEQLFRRQKEIVEEIDRVEMMLYKGNLNANEFEKMASKRRNLLIEQERVNNEIKRKYKNNGSND